MLQNAVHGIEELRQVKNTADHIETTSGTAMSYDGYVSLLLSASSAYDEQFKPKRPNAMYFYTTYMIMMMIRMKPSLTMTQHLTLIVLPAPFKHMLLTSGPNLWLNLTMQELECHLISGLAFDAASKAIWDCLDDKAKSIILGYTKPEPTKPAFLANCPPFGKSSFGQSGKPPFKAQANLHEISAYDFLLANIHDIAPSEDDPDPDLVIDEHEDSQVSDESNDTRLINAAKSSGNGPLPPGDIRRVMSKSSTRRVNSTHIAYHVSKHEALMAHSMSLIDRGANGGVAGDDVRIIFRTNRTVDIKGIDNHHVNNIGIGTVGGVVNTQHGPVIAIMHQYALLGKGASIIHQASLNGIKMMSMTSPFMFLVDSNVLPR